MTITLPEDLGNRIRNEAERIGLDPAELVRRVVAEHIRASDTSATIDELFGQWAAEDGTADPAEVERRNQEVESLKHSMNRNRVDSDGPDARVPFP